MYKPYFNMEFYHYCEKKVVKIFSKLRGITSICKFGSINAVGNSDIDLMFVVNKNCYIPGSIQKTMKNNFTMDEKYVIFAHEPFIIEEEIVDNVNNIRACSNLSHLWGKEFSIKKVRNIYIELFMLIDILIGDYPRLFDSKPHKREGMQYINAFKYTYGLYKKIKEFFHDEILINEVKLYETFKENDYLRDDFFFLSNKVNHKYFRSAFNVLLLCAETMKLDLSKLIINRFAYSVPNNKKSIIISNIIFTHNYPKITKKTIIKFLNKSLFFYTAPRIFLFIYTESSVFIKSFEDAINYRFNLLYKYLDFSERYNLGRNIFLPWWFRSKVNKKILVKNSLYNFCWNLYKSRIIS